MIFDFLFLALKYFLFKIITKTFFLDWTKYEFL